MALRVEHEKAKVVEHESVETTAASNIIRELPLQSKGINLSGDRT